MSMATELAAPDRKSTGDGDPGGHVCETPVVAGAGTGRSPSTFRESMP
ncbi:hypothetical protein [Pseudofulvimonas gallinarii]